MRNSTMKDAKIVSVYLTRCVASAILYLFCVTGAFIGTATDAFAGAGVTPSTTLQTSIDEVLVYLQKPEYADPSTRPPLRQAIKERIRAIFDFSEFSARAVGVYWKRFTPEQKAQLGEAFAELLTVTYLDKVQGYNGERIEYVAEIFSKKGNRAEVRTILTLADDTAVPVGYRMVFKGSSWVVYDIIIENISLVKNYRSQFGAVLQKGTPEDLIAKITERTNILKAGAKK